MRFILFIQFLLLSCQSQTYHEFVPTFYKNKIGLYKENRVLTEREKLNIKQVLSFYGHSYKEAEGKIYYKGFIDDELLWNYTTKANDTSWLLTHKK